MSIGTIPGNQVLLTKEEILAQLGEHDIMADLPYTVQAKLIFLIESLGVGNTTSTNTLQEKIDKMLEYLTPPKTCVATSATVGTSQSTLISAEAEGSTRKGFSIFNASTTATIYIDYLTGVSSTKKKLQLPPLYFWEPETIYQGNVYAVSTEANTTVEVRIER